MEITSSPLVQMAEEAKRPTRWWLAWIVAFLIIAFGGALGDAIGKPLLGTDSATQPLAQYAEVFSFGVTLLALFAWVWWKEGRPLTSLGFRGGRPLATFGLGLLIGAGMMTLGVLVPWLMGQYDPTASEHVRTGPGALVAIIPLLVVFTLQSSTEEAVTRGYMLQVGGLQLAAWPAVLGSSLFFSLLHLDFRPIVLLNITLYAVFACFVALGQGSLWLICGVHAGWNYFQGNVFGLPVSGHTYATSLWSFGPAQGSDDLLTGGNFGVEASAVGTVILVVALVIAYRYYRRVAAHREAEALNARATAA